MPLVYLAHAVGKEPIQREKNLANVQRWLKFLVDYGPESWAIGIPWLPYTLNLDEATYRERGLRDGQLFLKTFDIICLVGGDATRESIGANAEAETMKKLGRGVCDLRWLGYNIPTDPTVVPINRKWVLNTELTRDSFSTQCVLNSLKLNHS